jgi:NRPS condensation-like uncharacterized protein
MKERITPQMREGEIPVSFLQKIHIDGIKNNYYDPEKTRIPGPSLGYKVRGNIDIPAMHEAVKEIIRRHEILRTSYTIIDDRPYQVINKVPDNILTVIQLNSFKKVEQEIKANHIISKIASDKFDIFNDTVMIKFILISCEDEHKLLITTHHIATDAVSLMILERELFFLYEAFANNMLSPLPDLPVQYADYSTWERSNLSIDYLNEKLVYWKKVYSNSYQPALPVDYESKLKIPLTGDSEPVVIEKDLIKQLRELSRDNNVTLFTTLLAVYVSAIYCFSGYSFNESAIPVARRTIRETASLIGCFSDFQYVRIDFTDNPDFQEIIKRTNTSLINARKNYVPSSFYLKEMSSLPQYSKTQIGFNLIQSPYRSIKKGTSEQENRKIIPFKIPHPKTSLFAFSMDLMENTGSVNGTMTYQKELFDHSTIIKLVNGYINLLEDTVNNPLLRIREMNIPPHRS